MVELEKANADFVRDSYNYCVEYAEGDEHNDKVILMCVNDELAAAGFKKFKSLKEIKGIIKQK
ncbi:hypothetical protein [Colwellia sp. MEBiC06753]